MYQILFGNWALIYVEIFNRRKRSTLALGKISRVSSLKILQSYKNTIM